MRGEGRGARGEGVRGEGSEGAQSARVRCDAKNRQELGLLVCNSFLFLHYISFHCCRIPDQSYISAAHRNRPSAPTAVECRRRALCSAPNSSQRPEGTLAVVPNHSLDARVLRERILAQLASDPTLLEPAKGHIRVQWPGKR